MGTNGAPPDAAATAAAGVAAELRQSILCLLQATPSGKTEKMLSVITGRGKSDVGRVLGRMREAGEVALEALPGGTRAAITEAGKERLKEEIGGMVVLHRFLVDGQGVSP